MKSFTASILVVTLLVTGGMIRQYYLNNAQPLIMTGLNDHAGTIRKGTQLSHAIRFTNIGHGQLVLKSAIEGCTCTGVDTDSAVIAPGESRTIHMMVDTSGMETGPQVSYVDFELFSGSREWSETATITMTIH